MLIFVSWVVASSLLLFYLGNRHYGNFAPADWYNSPFTLQQLALPVVKGFQLVHVFDSGCACNVRAKRHVRQLQNDTALAQVQHYFFHSTQLAQAGFALPATPAILIFHAGKLIYAGPYASGPLCAIDDSLIVPILKQDLILPGLWLNSNVMTCRCSLT